MTSSRPGIAWQARRDDGDRADSENSCPIEQAANAQGTVLLPRPRGKPPRFPPPGLEKEGILKAVIQY